MSNRKLSVHQEHELLQKLEEAGLGPNETQTVIESKDNKLAKKVVDYIKSRRIFKFKNKKIAREILGNDIIFPDEITEVRGLSYSEEQLKQLDQMFPTEDMLRWCRYNNYAVMPAPPVPMSLLTILLLKPDLFSEGWWYANERFAKNDKTAFGWLIIYKDIVSESRDKIRSEQLRLLAKDERVPNIAELVWFISTYYEVRNIKLFKRVAARTSSFFRSHCVEVGYDCWGYSGLIVDHSDVDSICSGIGISAAR